MNKNEYDKLLLEQIGDKYIKPGTVYYDIEYFRSLYISLFKDNLTSRYKLELEENSQGVKMCSIGSSSRFCYLASKGKYKYIHDLEKHDLVYGCCRPHYDGYSLYNNTFYEFKCHELCYKSHRGFVKSYIPLLKEVFNIDSNDLSSLRFSDFGIKMDGDPIITKINFDFKQLVCHVLGLLSHVEKTKKGTRLLYFWVTPSTEGNDELAKFIEKVSKQMDTIFTQFVELEINAYGKKQKIKDIIELGYQIINAKDIRDVILEKIDADK